MTNELLFGIINLPHNWAEIKYGDHTGWVAIDYIDTERPYGADNSEDYPAHLDFRVYKFKDENNKSFSDDTKKQFFDPLEFFDFDVQFEYNMSDHDYH